MSSTTYLTVSMPIRDSSLFEQCFNRHIDKLIEKDESHYNVFEKLKVEGISKYITSTTKGDMFGFSMEVNYLNSNNFIEVLSLFIDLCKRELGLFQCTSSLVVLQSEYSEVASIFSVDEINYKHFTTLTFGYNDYEN